MASRITACFIAMVVALPVLALAAPQGKAGASKAVSGSAVADSGPLNLTTAARISWLDKQTNVITPVVLMAGKAQNLGDLQVMLTKCVPDYGGQPGQDMAWLSIKEVAGRQTPWFEGWMFSETPDVSTLDHPRYDVQVKGCGEKARRIGRAASAPVPGGDEAAAAARDSEAPSAEAPADSGTAPDASATVPVSSVVPGGAAAQPAADPYYVPGVDDKPTPAASAPVTAAPIAKPQPSVAPQPTSPAPTNANPDAGALHQMMEGGTY
jgi:hypothetical protein